MVNALFSFAVFLCAAGQQLEDEYAREKLQPLTKYRQQHRRTMDGRLCAAAFVQDRRGQRAKRAVCRNADAGCVF